MTPYAELMVRPTDTDEMIRARFHVLSRACHPDLVDSPQARATWFRIAGAYSAVKTAVKRATYDKGMQVLARRCRTCNGSGVQGSRSAGSKIRVCVSCAGEGRAKK